MHLFIHQIVSQHTPATQPRVLSLTSPAQSQFSTDHEPILDLLPISGTHSILILTFRNARFQSNALKTPRAVRTFNILEISNDNASVALNDVIFPLNRINTRTNLTNASASIVKIMNELNITAKDESNGTAAQEMNFRHSSVNFAREQHSYLYGPPSNKSAMQSTSKKSSNPSSATLQNRDRRRPMSATTRTNPRLQMNVKQKRPSSAQPRSAISSKSHSSPKGKVTTGKMRGSFAQKTIKAATKVYGNNKMLENILRSREERAFQNTPQRKRPAKPSRPARLANPTQSSLYRRTSKTNLSKKSIGHKAQISSAATDEWFDLLEKEMERELMLRNVRKGSIHQMLTQFPSTRSQVLKSQRIKYPIHIEKKRNPIEPRMTQIANHEVKPKVNHEVAVLSSIRKSRKGEDERVYESGLEEMESPRIPNDTTQLIKRASTASSQDSSKSKFEVDHLGKHSKMNNNKNHHYDIPSDVLKQRNTFNNSNNDSNSSPDYFKEHIKSSSREAKFEGSQQKNLASDNHKSKFEYENVTEQHSSSSTISADDEARYSDLDDSIELKIGEHTTDNHRYNHTTGEEFQNTIEMKTDTTFLNQHSEHPIQSRRSSEWDDYEHLEEIESPTNDEDSIKEPDVHLSTMKFDDVLHQNATNNRYMNDEDTYPNTEENTPSPNMQNDKNRNAPNFNDANDFLQVSDEEEESGLNKSFELYNQDDELFASDNDSDPFEDELESDDEYL